MKNRDVSVYAEEFDYIVKIGYKKFLFKTAGPAINFARDAVGRQVSDNDPDEVCIVIIQRLFQPIGCQRFLQLQHGLCDMGGGKYRAAAVLHLSVGYLYHGRVQSLADAAREAGLKF